MGVFNMEDFEYCVWLSPADGHPWHEFIERVPAHVTVKSYISSLPGAQAIFALLEEPIEVRLIGVLHETCTNGFYALVHDVAPVCATVPSWWPTGAHISFAYKYDTPFSAVEKEVIARKLSEMPQSASVQTARIVKATGPFNQWHENYWDERVVG